MDGMIIIEVVCWVYENGVVCDVVMYGYNYFCCCGVDVCKFGFVGLFVSELWFSFGLSGCFVGVDIYCWGMNVSDIIIVWNGVMYVLCDVFGILIVIMGDVLL